MSKLFNVPEVVGKEEWRDVVGFEGFYQVSNLGRIRSVARICTDGKEVKGQIRKVQGSTYLSIDLWKDGKNFNKSVHRIVAEAFLPNPSNLPEVNHKDSNPQNNSVDNLEWVTCSENSRHRLANQTSYKYRREVKCLETGEIFRSISAAGRSVQASTQQVIDSIHSESCCKGVTFVYTDGMPEDKEAYLEAAHAKYQNYHKRPTMQNSKKVRVVETGEIFDSMASTARYYQIDSTTVADRIREHRTVRGLTFEFVE